MKRLLLVVPVLLFAAACNCQQAAGASCKNNSNCKSGSLCCAGQCKDVTSDSANCGACGTACASVNGTASCSAGKCQVACSAGFADCNQDPRDGCEASLTATSSCGSCGSVCSYSNAGAVCGGSGCALGSCNLGFGNCDADAGNGCETDIRNSTANCGGCGKVCDPANATGRCLSGVCKAFCVTNYGDCDNNVANGCETNLLSSAAHCGDCNTPCPDGQICQNGACASATLVLYGGIADLAASAPAATADVWQVDVHAQDGGIFTKLAPTGTGPGARFGHVAFWDSAHQRMLVWGGVQGLAPADTKLYALDFTSDPPAWSTVATTGTPPTSRFDPVASYDRDGGLLYLFGGTDIGTGTANSLTDFYALDVNALSWARLADGGTDARTYACGAFDPPSGLFVVFGGGDPNSGVAMGDGWTWDTRALTTAWTKLIPTGPNGTLGSSMSGFGPLYMYGGVSGDSSGGFSSTSDLWTLTFADGGAWQLQSAANQLPSRAFHASTWNEDSLVVFGGENFAPFGGETPLNDLWSYAPDAGAWTQLSQNGAPGAPTGNSVFGTLISRQ